MKKVVLSIFLVLFTCLNANAGFKEIGEATCKVKTSRGVGTGTVFKENEKSLFILTAAHVISNELFEPDSEVVLYFYNTGYKSSPIKGAVIWSEYSKTEVLDIAVISVDKELFNDYPIPKPIPIADEGCEISKSDVVLSYGCPSGNWPSGWKGHISDVSADRIMFLPMPLGGRSGSGIFDSKGEKIIGIIIWKTGTAVHLNTIIKTMKSH